MAKKSESNKHLVWTDFLAKLISAAAPEINRRRRAQSCHSLHLAKSKVSFHFGTRKKVGKMCLELCGMEELGIMILFSPGICRRDNSSRGSRNRGCSRGCGKDQRLKWLLLRWRNRHRNLTLRSAKGLRDRNHRIAFSAARVARPNENLVIARSNHIGRA